MRIPTPETKLRLRVPCAAWAAMAATGLVGAAHAQTGLVNWESPHVHPLALTPDGTRLLAVNTAAATLEVFAVADGSPAAVEWIASVPVGLDPVSVRARTDTEAWVVNHVSDSVSIVDLVTLSVSSTVLTGDEPTDVVFAGTPERAFVCISQENRIAVLDPDDLGAEALSIDIAGEDPRALATDGSRVFAAIFEAGNGTTILEEARVSSPVNPYPGDPNPPPNDGTAFAPPIAGDLPTPPRVGLIVRKDGDGAWRDDNGGNWSGAVAWDLHGHGAAIVDASSLEVTYVRGLLNANMALGVDPAGDVLVVGTQAINEVRFEPNLRGIFVRVMAARFAPTGGTPVTVDLNPHLDYATPTVPQAERDRALGDPRGIAFAPDGTRAYVVGMGSNNLVALDGGLERVGRVEVGEGPTGVVASAGGDALFVLNRFEGTISVLDAAALAESERVAFHDPTPVVIRTGRPFLYDTHATSGLGQVSCASCHIDGRMDQLAWDLGDPQGAMKPFNQVCNFGTGGCEDWHPMKGPLATQTLVGIIGTEPFHWRADREDLAAFAGAFEALMGDDEMPSAEAMLAFEAFVATLTMPPNPFRDIFSKLPTYVPQADGNPRTGAFLYEEVQLDVGALSCNDCHALPTGTNGQLTSAALIQETQSMKIPQLRNLYEKTGFDDSAPDNNRGFGFIHDGSVDTLFEFLQFPGFQFDAGGAGDQQRRDVEAFLLALSTDTHAGVGAQVTVDGADAEAITRRNKLEQASDLTDVALIVKGLVEGAPRGWQYLGSDLYQSDRAAETATTAELDALATASPLTWTLVPLGTEVRYGVDRDADGFLDQDERDACSDPADPESTPGDPGCPADVDRDGTVGVSDLLAVLGAWGGTGDADVTCDGAVGVEDLLAVLAAWGECG